MKKYYWNIFEVAREERTDGGTFEGDLGTAARCWLNGLTPGGKRYACMEGLDKAAVLAELDTPEKQADLVNAFNEAIDIDGIILTKLDGTAKGGVVIAINRESGIPVRFIGVGEGIDDLEVFDAQSFVEGII